MHVDEVRESLRAAFGWLDYLIFIGMLLGCTIVGVYYAVKDNRRTEVNDFEENYLVGGRRLHIFPVALSLIATWISGITVLGSPSEIYMYGSGFMLVCIPMLMAAFIVAKVFLPVFVELKITSLYEYLQIRFDRRVRLLGSGIFAILLITLLGIVIYVPALAFNQMTGFDIYTISILVCIVCIFYTCIGGIKAVIWTDVIQTVIMFGTIVLIVVKGTLDVGGLSVVLERNFNSSRIEFPPLIFDFTTRLTVPTILIGGTIYYVQNITVYQSIMQRYLSLPDMKSVKKAVFIFIVGGVTFTATCCFLGLVIHATYHDCDPLSSQLAKNGDQLLPLLVIRLFKNLPGLPGLFVAGIFSASLSTLSTGLNSFAAVVLEDFIKPFRKKPLTETQTKYILKGMVLVTGAISVALVYVVSKLGNVLQLSMSLGGIGTGPLLGIFIIGVSLPWINGKSALFGGLCGMCVMTYIIVRAQTDMAIGELSFTKKPVSVSGCDYIFDQQNSINQTLLINSNEMSFQIHRVSYIWYVSIGVLTTCITAILSSLVFGLNNIKEFDCRLLTPSLRHIFKTPTISLPKEENEEKVVLKSNAVD